MCDLCEATPGRDTCSERVTCDLSRFGAREKEMAGNILLALARDGVPNGMEDTGLRIWMNTDSGNVFLSDGDCAIAMLNRNRLEVFFHCPECGDEGFWEEFRLHAPENDENTTHNCREHVRMLDVFGLTPLPPGPEW